MKDQLNLQALKHSKNRKHNTIYEKAHRIMQSGFETPDLKEQEIMEMARKFPQLDVTVQLWGNIIIKSKKDTWVIVDEGRFYTLYHRGMSFEKGRTKEKYHIQDVFYDIEFIFGSIISHDDYALGIKARTVNEIHELVQQAQAVN